MDRKNHSRLLIKVNTEQTKVLSFLCFLIILIYSSSLKASAALSSPLIESFLTYVIVPLILGSIFLKSFRKITVTSNRIVITLVLVVYYALNIFYIYTAPMYSRILVTVVCIVVLFQNESTQAEAFGMMKKAIAVSCIIGVVLEILLLLGAHGRLISDPIDYRRQFVSYYLFYFYKATGYWRYCGFYNEPGALGTFCALYLCADSLNLRKKENIALLIGGILSFSLAFFVLIGLFAAIRSATNWKRWTLLTVIVVIYLFVLPNISTGNAGIDTLLQRISFDGDSLSGDNRTNKIIESLYNETLLNSRYFLFGRKLGYANVTSHFSVNLVGPSYKTYIVDLGVVGSILLFAPLCIAEFKRVKTIRTGWIYIIVSFVNLYQRAMLLHRVIYFLSFICGVSYILQNKDSYVKAENESPYAISRIKHISKSRSKKHSGI